MKYHQNYAPKYKLFGKILGKQLIITALFPYFIPNLQTILGVKKDSVQSFVKTTDDQGFVTIALLGIQIGFTYCKVASYNAPEQHSE